MGATSTMTNTQKKLWEPKVGDHAAIRYYSDVVPCTVIKRTAKFVWVQRDKYKLQADWKPEIIAGGFCGHCTNNYDQRYDFTRDENGSIDKYGIRKDGRWYACGQRYGATRLTEGWAAFYDYNY